MIWIVLLISFGWIALMCALIWFVGRGKGKTRLINFEANETKAREFEAVHERVNSFPQESRCDHGGVRPSSGLPRPDWKPESRNRGNKEPR